MRENPWVVLDPEDECWKDGGYYLLYYGDEKRQVVSGTYNEELERWEPHKLPSHGCGCCGYPNKPPTHIKELELP
jgi:hypothetical protein